MKRLTLVLVLMFLLVAVASVPSLAFPKKIPKASVAHECVYVYDVDGEEQSFTSYAEECPDDEGWWDNGPTRNADVTAKLTSSTSQEEASEMSDLHECVFVYDVDGEERTLTFYAEECPEDGVWWDNGSMRNSSVAEESTISSARLTMATTTLTDYKCVYTYVLNGVKYTYTVCAPQCPDYPSWTDYGTPCP
ncbi:hypothetical protein [Desulfosarcina variabilis]|uniref:hypothetical protein n=1 Tax=Desulfosarcina variabilis TaxID=2300 RepID=UPI003AFAF87D